MTPKEMLLLGAAILAKELEPSGFSFQSLADGSGSGGAFASGEFRCGEKRLELHYRFSLGLVTYHVGIHSLTHDEYMRFLGRRSSCAFPTCESEGMAPFQALASDLHTNCQDFITGSGEEVVRFADRLRQSPELFSGIIATDQNND